MKTLTGQQKVLVTTLVLFGAGSETAWAGINEWTSIGPDGGSIQALAIDPQNPGTVYASTQFNVYRSTDGALSWAKTGFTGHANSLVIDPRNSDTVYAPTPTGVSKSTDAGASWSAQHGRRFLVDGRKFRVTGRERRPGARGVFYCG
jgi:hypothetical protein